MAKSVSRITIKTVTFRSSVQLKSFQHAHVEATADVPADRTPQQVLDALKGFVAEELRRAKEGDEPKPVPERSGRFRV